MRNSLLSGMVALIILTSCEKINRDVILVINDDIEFKADDISMYDSSTHILYLKREHSELQDIESGSFAFYDKGDPVLSGRIWPSYLSSTPSTPVIMSFPFLLQSFALQIETWGYPEPAEINKPEFTNLMNRNGLLHSGLEVNAAAPVINGSEMSFTLAVTNMDEESLMILDAEKTGPGLFRYFSNGLYLYDPDDGTEEFADNISSQSPDPWDSWSTDWLTELGPGESKSFTFTYTLTTVPAAGEYRVVFVFPGLSYQVSADELYQGSSRIWLGDVIFSQKMTIE
jgi:hypothetical protein